MKTKETPTPIYKDIHTQEPTQSETLDPTDALPLHDDTIFAKASQRALRLQGRERATEYLRINHYVHNKLASIALDSTVETGTRSMQPVYDMANRVYESFEDTRGDNPVERFHTGLYALMPDLINAAPVLQNKSNYNNKEIRQAKNAAISFNHLIREAIDYHPNLTKGEITLLSRYVAYSYLIGHEGVSSDTFKEQWPSIDNQLQAIVRGVQHEVVFEDIMHKLQKDYACRPGTLEEDAKGIDYVITDKHSQQKINVDVKASIKSARQTQKYKSTDIALATGLNDEDFTRGALVAKPTAINRELPHIKTKLQEAFSMQNTHPR